MFGRTRSVRSSSGLGDGEWSGTRTDVWEECGTRMDDESDWTLGFGWEVGLGSGSRWGSETSPGLVPPRYLVRTRYVTPGSEDLLGRLDRTRLKESGGRTRVQQGNVKWKATVGVFGRNRLSVSFPNITFLYPVE